MERFIDVDGARLWAEATGPEDPPALLLVMGANTSGVAWPDELVELLAERRRVIRYDHRDTGRSTWAYDERPYAIGDLAPDAVAVLDGFDVDRAHVVGMSMGGVLVQLLLLDAPERLRSATVFCTTALGRGLASAGGADVDLPGPDPRLLAMWAEMGEPRPPEAEMAWRVEHWRILNGDQLPFDPDEVRRMEQRIIDHTGRPDSPSAHARADQTGLDRGAELTEVTVPTLVVEAPADPVNPPPARCPPRPCDRRSPPRHHPRHGPRPPVGRPRATRPGLPHPHLGGGDARSPPFCQSWWRVDAQGD